MATVLLSDVLQDMRAAEQSLHLFEQRYWLSSEVFYDLYSHGQLDDGEHLDEFAEWAGHYQVKCDREAVLREFSRKRIAQLRSQQGETIRLFPQEPALEFA